MTCEPAAVPRRPGALGVHSIDGFHLVVPDLATAERFYSAFGLDVRPAGTGLGLHTDGHDHRWGSLSEGPAKRLSHISFGAFEEDLPAFRARLREAGVPLVAPPPGTDSNGLWFLNPDGLPMEIRVAEKSSPNAKTCFAMPSVGAGVQGSVPRSQAPRVRPRRLSHVLIFTRDVLASIAFYHRILGLRLSDRSGDGVAFLHGIHGSDHHMLALARSDGPGLHHVSWDVGSVNEVGLGAAHMAGAGFAAGWGVGRHVLGSNYFHYVRDPWGSWSEYSADMDYIPADCDWPGADNPAEDAFYLWGPNPPADFVINHETRS